MSNDNPSLSQAPSAFAGTPPQDQIVRLLYSHQHFLRSGGVEVTVPDGNGGRKQAVYTIMITPENAADYEWPKPNTFWEGRRGDIEGLKKVGPALDDKAELHFRL